MNDNTALVNAIAQSRGQLIPVFVLDDALLRGADVAPARVQFMLESLRDLDASLHARGSRLIVRRGDTRTELLTIARETGAQALYFNKDYTPRARARDAAVTAELARNRIRCEAFKDQVHFEETEVLTGARSPYTVFTPYKNAWLARPKPLPTEPAEIALVAPPQSLRSLPVPTAAELGHPGAPAGTPRGGETQALALLQAWVNTGRIAKYDATRNTLAADGTSKLSAHLRFGTLSPRICVQAAELAKQKLAPKLQAGCDLWISELIWREFYQQVLFNFPHADTGSFKKGLDALRWGSGSQAKDDALFAAWCEGRTGFPVIDAAMRQLKTEAWMHNRARMIVASFFTKDLLLDWRRGERYFMQTLVDGDPAANNGGWQWAASTGTDAQPYFRVFNPRLQSEKFDADGAYIRRYVPELARVPAKQIHAPADLAPIELAAYDIVPGETYPAPIVDHALQKDEILRRFKALKDVD